MPNSYSCLICDISFYKKWKFNEHNKRVHSSVDAVIDFDKKKYPKITKK
jgi:hypothetical protein